MEIIIKLLTEKVNSGEELTDLERKLFIYIIEEKKDSELLGELTKLSVDKKFRDLFISLGNEHIKTKDPHGAFINELFESI